jgi:hypothetical protein
MRQREKRKKRYDRVEPYVRPPELKKYPRMYLKDKTLMSYLIWMYNSLDERRLKTVIIKATNPQFSNHGVRSNENTNPLWFKNYCSQYIEKRRSKRKGSRKRRRNPKFTDTKIQAIHTQRALMNFIKNGYSHSSYSQDFIEIAESLKEEVKMANELYRKGEDYDTINQECQTIRDLEDISMELSKKETFKVAEGFEDNYECSIFSESEIPF